jgi:hypothetical protein
MNEATAAWISAWRRNASLIAAAGCLVCAGGFLRDRDELLRSYLFAAIYWTGVAMGCLGILLLHHTVGGKWGLVIRRLCEAGARTIPYCAILFLPVILAMPTLYPWARPEAASDPIIQSKSAYLNVPFFIARTAFYFGIWTLYAYLLSRWSAKQDQPPDGAIPSTMRSIGGPGLVVFTFTATFAFVDWIMSLSPEWFSTIYGAMFIIGQVLSAFAFVIAVVVVLSRWDPIRQYITAQHFHDLGNLLLAFTVLWAYLSLSQFLIIWAGNLPDEVPWYVRRLGGGWGTIAALLLVFHFCLPFLLLLQRGIKRRPRLLLNVCLLMLGVRMLDVYWVVEPSLYGGQPQFHLMDFVTPVAVGGLWLAVFFWQLGMRPLAPVNDPQLQVAPREMVVF